MDEDLVEFNKLGGSIFIFPGNNIDFSEYRLFLKALNLPELGPFVSNGLKIDQINFKDPFFRGVFEKENKSLNLPKFFKKKT